jgi:hypothetical protein
MSSRPPPPESVRLVARTHWLVGGVIVVSVGALHLLTRQLPVAFSAKTYVISLGLGALYLLAGTLVWFGRRPGRLLSRICGLLYLVRPGLGSHLWRLMSSPEYQAHFGKKIPPIWPDAV